MEPLSPSPDAAGYGCAQRLGEGGQCVRGVAAAEACEVFLLLRDSIEQFRGL
jgi:hypothetical protein